MNQGEKPQPPEVVFHQARRIPRPVEKSFIHPMSAALLAIVDGMWAIPEMAVLSWAVTIPLAFLSVTIGTSLIQQHLNGDQRGRAVAIAFFFGIIAALPTCVLGTPLGLGLLARAGLKHLLKPRRPKSEFV